MYSNEIRNILLHFREHYSAQYIIRESHGEADSDSRQAVGRGVGTGIGIGLAKTQWAEQAQDSEALGSEYLPHSLIQPSLDGPGCGVARALDAFCCRRLALVDPLGLPTGLLEIRPRRTPLSPNCSRRICSRLSRPRR